MNVSGNLMYIVSQFDHWDRVRLAGLLSKEASNHVSVRMLSGGADEKYDVFNIWMKK